MYALQTRGTLIGESTKSRVWARFYVAILSSDPESAYQAKRGRVVGRAHLALGDPKSADVTAGMMAKLDDSERSGPGTHP